MSQAFIIMQIGNQELDAVYDGVFVPALLERGVEPKRVDKHNEGGLLTNEITDLIETSDLIIADLTNERPNCYLEVGYALGIGKERNLILTAREDHKPDRLNRRAGDPKVHFDLSGYDILFWSAEDLEDFRTELVKRIVRRQANMVPVNPELASLWKDDWQNEQRAVALDGLQQNGLTGYMEMRFALQGPKPNVENAELLKAAQEATISTLRWPLGAVMTRDDLRPRPKKFGVSAEMALPNQNSYDFWALRRDGDFYLLASLPGGDTNQDESYILFNMRIIRVAEALLYCAGLYARLGVPTSAFVSFGVRHGGLRGRRLASGSPRRIMFDMPTTVEDEHEWESTFPLSRIDSDLVNLVKEFTQPLFELFDFTSITDSVYEDIVKKFVDGKVS